VEGSESGVDGGFVGDVGDEGRDGGGGELGFDGALGREEGAFGAAEESDLGCTGRGEVACDVCT